MKLVEHKKTSTFTDQQPFEVTEQELSIWKRVGAIKNFRCAFCGHKFKVGDIAKWIFTNDIKGAYGNPFTCKKCDEGNKKMRQRWVDIHKKVRQFKTTYWWFFKKMG